MPTKIRRDFIYLSSLFFYMMRNKMISVIIIKKNNGYEPKIIEKILEQSKSQIQIETAKKRVF